MNLLDDLLLQYITSLLNYRSAVALQSVCKRFQGLALPNLQLYQDFDKYRICPDPALKKYGLWRHFGNWQPPIQGLFFLDWSSTEPLKAGVYFFHLDDVGNNFRIATTDTLYSEWPHLATRIGGSALFHQSQAFVREFWNRF